jgi:RHS repeat-associated protein
VTVREFPALGFDPAPGDAAALDSAATDVAGTGKVFGDASANVTRLNSSGWTGDAADAFRGQLKDLPRDLDLAARSHQTAAKALTEYGTGLTARQRRAAELETQAAELRRRESAAVAEVNRLAGQTAPSGSPEFTRLKHQYDSAHSTATSLGSDLQEVIAAARRLHGEHRDAASTAATKIRNVADAPYKEPGWLSRAWSSVKGWIADHADALAKISSVLKGISAVLGVLSLVPGLQFLAPFALLTAGAALAIDVALKVATGKGSWASIGIDAALTFLPGGKILSGLKGVKAAVAGERGLVAGERALASGEKLLAEGDDAAKALKSATTDAREVAVSFEKKVCEADPIDVVTGRMVMRQVDVELAGALPLVLARTHTSGYRVGRSFGPAWASTLDLRIEPDGGLVRFADDDGTVLVYPVPTSGPVLPVEGPRLPLTADDEGWTITRPTGQALRFGPSGWLLSLTDRLGTSRIEIERDPAGTPVELRHTGGYRIAVESERGRITSLRLRDGERWTELARYGYDEGGRLAAVVNSSGVPLRFRSDAGDRIVRWDDRNGTWYGYDFDAAGRCVRTTGADGALSATFAYDDQVTVVTNSLGARKTFQHNELKQVVRETDALGHTTLSTWDRYDRLLSRTDPLGRTTRWTYDEDGNLLRVDRPDGTSTEATYGPLGLPIRVVEPDGATWLYTYDQRGLMTAATDPAGATTRYRYDVNGHLAAVTDALLNTRTVVADAAGLGISAADPLGATTTYRRDAFGRVVEIVDPLDAVTRFEWTVDGKPAARTLPDGTAESWQYDGEGNLIEHVDALGHATRFTIEGFDRVTSRTAPDGARMGFRWDSELRLVAATDPSGLVWTYDYDPAGRLVRETDFDGRVIAYRYDAAGQLVERSTAAGTVRLGYDAGGRLTRREVDGDVTTFRYDPADRLVAATGADGTELEVAWDRTGRVISEAVDGRVLATGYDLAGRRTWRRTPSGAETRWEYGPDDLPVALRAGAHTMHFERDAIGRELRRTVDQTAAVESVWSPVDRLVGLALAVPDPAGTHRLVDRTFDYRADGALTTVQDEARGPRRYDVDTTGRITAVSDTGERYSYRPTGGLAGSPDGDRWDYQGTRLRRGGNVRYEHDAAGRVVLRQHKTLSGRPQTWRYRWDALDRLVEVRTPDGVRWRYRYDPLGRRVAKQRLDADGRVAEEVLFSWDGTSLAEQTTAAGATVWDWDRSGRQALSQRDLSDAEVDERFYGIVTDIVGTPTELYGPDGTIAWQATATLWGATAGTGSASCPLRFPGQYEDVESGLHYNYYRYYDPRTGRYTSPDPLGLDGGDDPGAYVPNPLRWTDPLGLTPCDPAGMSRNAAFRDAKRDAGITSDQVPVVRKAPMTDSNGHVVKDPVTKQPISTREYEYTMPDGRKVYIQDHGAGHDFGEGGVGDQGPHFNVRPPDPETGVGPARTGKVPGTKPHYPFVK